MYLSTSLSTLGAYKKRKRTLAGSQIIISDKTVATRENVQSNMCAQRRLKSACASTQSNQNLRRPDEATLHPYLSQNAQGEDSDQATQMCRLI